MVSRWLVALVVVHPTADSSPTPDSGSESLALVIAGPTASGKTALALALAQALAPGLAAEIVSCDSVAVYRGLEIGSAKPTAAQRALVPHHLLDVADPDSNFSAGDYARQARAAMRAIAARGAVPILTGGTGLYLRALVQGLFAGPQRNDDLRQRLVRRQAQRGQGWLHRLLQRLDPVAAARIHANDTPKLIRALEVTLAARRPMTTQLADGREPLTGFRLLWIGLDPPRPSLYARINARAAQMFDDGLVAETESLLARYGPVRALDALGYRQAQALLRGEVALPQAIAAAQQGHRNYAKRQITWFRREPQMRWIHAFGDDPQTLPTALAQIQVQRQSPSRSE